MSFIKAPDDQLSPEFFSNTQNYAKKLWDCVEADEAAGDPSEDSLVGADDNGRNAFAGMNKKIKKSTY